MSEGENERMYVYVGGHVCHVSLFILADIRHG